MIAISSDDYINYQCPNINCESTNFTSIKEFDDYSLVKCDECEEEFYISFSSYGIWINNGEKDERGNPKIIEIPISKHPKSKILKEERSLLDI